MIIFELLSLSLIIFKLVYETEQSLDMKCFNCINNLSLCQKSSVSKKVIIVPFAFFTAKFLALYKVACFFALKYLNLLSYIFQNFSTTIV